MPLTHQELTAHFAAAMDQLGPFDPNPALAVAVSGGADSMALAILTRDWASCRRGTVVALIVDHGLRTASAEEARLTSERLTASGVPSRIMRLAGLTPGPALAARARDMRYTALQQACSKAGLLHLLLGHHAADQVETLVMRVLRGSQTHGLAGMSALREQSAVRLLRPLLGIAPAALRRFLQSHGIAWVEDPSNQDPRALRARLRHRLMSAPDHGLCEALSAVGCLRQREEAATAAELADRVTIRPEGFARVSAGRIGVAALRSLIATIGGAAYPPGTAQLSGLAESLRPATVAGVRILPAGRLGDGMLVVREDAAIGPPIPAFQGAVWDRRFRLVTYDGVPECATIGALGDDAARFRRRSALPSAVLRTLPAIRIGETLASVPHLGYGCQEYDRCVNVLFSPPRAASSAGFIPVG